MTTVPTSFGLKAVGHSDTDYSRDFWERHRDFLELEARTQWYWRAVYGDILDAILRFLPSTAPEGYDCTPVVLDVGCGQGFFVRYLRSRGVPAYGLDPADPEVFPVPPKDWWYIQGSFPDKLGELPRSITVLTAFNVLEHVEDPHAWIQAAREWLHPEGLLVLQVPNESNPLQRRLTVRHGFWWRVPEHRNYFFAHGFRRFVEEAGFEILDEWRTFPMELFALLGFNYIRHPRLGLYAHYTRMVLERLIGRPGREALRRLWRRLDWGREVILFARVGGEA